MPAEHPANQIHITRLYDAALADVWEAWTDPAQVAQWWGPRGFSLTTHSKELRPGGHWAYTMHGPDGTEYENKTIYHEVETGRKLVYDHGGNDDRPPLFRVTALFSEKAGKTKLELTMTLPTPEAAQETRGFIKKAGGDATWDRLAEYLSQKTSGREQFVINRTLAAPREVVFEMWTNPEQIVRWLPPNGFSMQYRRADIRPGGGSSFVMSNDAGITMYGRVEYLTIEPPCRLSYRQEFCDENELPARHPLAPTWPATMLIQVDFTSEDPDSTRVTVACEVIGDVLPVELETFIQGRAGMTQGWTGSFDKLEECLASAAAHA